MLSRQEGLFLLPVLRPGQGAGGWGQGREGRQGLLGLGSTVLLGGEVFLLLVLQGKRTHLVNRAESSASGIVNSISNKQTEICKHWGIQTQQLARLPVSAQQRHKQL